MKIRVGHSSLALASAIVAAFACSPSEYTHVFPSRTNSVAPTGAPPLGPQPSFGATVSQAEPPPPISGGTLAIAPDGVTAVAADPDRDRVYVVDLPARAVRHTLAMPARSE